MRHRIRANRGENGFVVSSELVMIVTLVVIGLIVGLVAIRDATVAEMGDWAESLGAVDQSYSYEGLLDSGTNAAVAGAAWGDTSDNGPLGELQGFAGDEVGIDFNLGPSGDEDVQPVPLP